MTAIEATSIPDAWVCTPRVFADDRGEFLEWFRGDVLRAATGRGFTPVQANHSVSRRGVVRGLHFADVPPGQAKYVYCASGAVLDIVVDIRTGSPTFGQYDAVRLDDADRCGIFISEGLGHAFCALTDDASVTYLVSTPYEPAAEHTVSPLDPELGLPWPFASDGLVLSDKDLAGATMQQAVEQGLLPSYTACQAHYAALSARSPDPSSHF